MFIQLDFKTKLLLKVKEQERQFIFKEKVEKKNARNPKKQVQLNSLGSIKRAIRFINLVSEKPFIQFLSFSHPKVERLKIVPTKEGMRSFSRFGKRHQFMLNGLGLSIVRAIFFLIQIKLGFGEGYLFCNGDIFQRTDCSHAAKKML